MKGMILKNSSENECRKLDDLQQPAEGSSFDVAREGKKHCRRLVKDVSIQFIENNRELEANKSKISDTLIHLNCLEEQHLTG